jgi:hypothetical protein
MAITFDCTETGVTSQLHSKSPRLGNPSVSDTWSPAKIVRKVEFKLLHQISNESPPEVDKPSLEKADSQVMRRALRFSGRGFT